MEAQRIGDTSSRMDPELFSSQAGGVTFTIQCYGLRIGISLCEATLFDDVVERLPPDWHHPAGAGSLDRMLRIDRAEDDASGFTLYVDDSPWCVGADIQRILDVLESDVQMFVAEFAESLLFVHAGVVRWHGTVIMLPGASFSGKTTLVAALVQAGATYFSDEYAVLDDQGLVHPYRRRLSLRDGPFGPAHRLDLGRHAPSPDPIGRGEPIGLVLFATYDPHSAWSCTLLGHGAAILSLCEHTVAIQRRPADTLRLLTRVAERAEVFKARRPDLETPVGWLREIVTTRTRCS